MTGRHLNVVVLGLTLSSSWGNGHATTYRALLKAFAARGHAVLFLERDVPWYAAHRDLANPDYARLAFYGDLCHLEHHRNAIANADAVIVGSYVPEGVAVGHFVIESARGAIAFYDIDTPVTLALLESGDCAYLSPDLIPAFDLYLSFTGGPTLDRLMRRYRSPATRALYCSVDPAAYPQTATPKRWDLSYLGTYSTDRQPALDRLLVSVAREAPHRSFAVAGPLYPNDIRWPDNVERIDHVPPGEHGSFYAASRFTLNITRADMIRAGYSPSVRLFEAAACGTPVISDAWEGLDTLFEPGREIVVADDGSDVLAALEAVSDERSRIGEAARRRVLKDHTAAHRAETLETLLHEAIRRRHAGASPLPRASRALACAEGARDRERVS